ncbi:MAG: hypothetical protein IT229_00725 [Flavobacteriales bacterium]|nr:hypothetical protein [Flavobacteriales bacterium]
MSVRKRRAFLLLAALAFAYVAMRAYLVPLTHYEARTFFVYTLSGRFLPFLSHWDAGNHLLCTALGWLSYEAFGMAPWSLRLFSVLSFLLYAWYVWRWGLLLHRSVVRGSFWAALLFAPVLIEFFSMYRGYGMATAFLLMALYHTTALIRDGGRNHLIAALLAWLLAALSMLSLMILWCAALGVIALDMVINSRSARARITGSVLWLTLGILPLVGVSLYARELKDQGLLYFGTEDGLYRGTLRSLTVEFFGTDAAWLMVPVALIMLMTFSAICWSLFRSTTDRWRSTAVVLTALFLVELLGRLVLGEGFGVLYPTGRTALHWLPLAVLLFAFAVDGLAVGKGVWQWASLLLLALPIRTLTTLNLSYVRSWPEEAISANIYDTVGRLQRAAPRPLLVDGYRQMPPPWDHERLWMRPALPLLSSHGFPQANCDLLLIDTTYFTAPPGFHTIATSATGRQVLKQRNVPIQLALMNDSVLAPTSLNDEFHGLWEPNAQELVAQELVLELKLDLRSDARCLETLLVIEVDGPDGEHLHYDQIELRTLQPEWTGDTLHIMRRLPILSGNAKRVVCYFWNRHRQNLSLSSGRVRTLRIQPDHDLRNP